MPYETFLTIAVALRHSIKAHFDNRNHCSLPHRKWVRQELRNTIQALRDIRTIEITY
jgi:hypothetical protein